MLTSIVHSTNDCLLCREVTLTKSDEFKYFGFTARGSNPVFLNMVDPGGLADSMTVKEGDHVLAVNGVDTMRLSHKQVRLSSSLFQCAGLSCSHGRY